MDKEVGERIRHVRLDKGYTRDTLSMMSGVSEKYIFQIERQHTGFSVDILLKLTKHWIHPVIICLEGIRSFLMKMKL